MLPLAILSLFAGPLLWSLLARRPALLRRIDMAMHIILAILVLGVLLPELWEAAGWWSLFWLLVGFAAPALLEYSLHEAAHKAHVGTLVLAVLGFGLHALVDGVGLVIGSHGLPWAIVLHRLAVGLAVWLVIASVSTQRMAYGVLAILGLTTALGYFLAQELMPLTEMDFLAQLQAVIVGMVLHGLVHRPGHSH